MKVLGIGMPKTGTTSLSAALRILGFRCGHYLTGPIVVNIVNEEYDVLRELDAVTDFPAPLIYRELDSSYSGCRFIYTDRNEREWIRSVERHFSRFRPNNILQANSDSFLYYRLAMFGTIEFDRSLFLRRFDSHRQAVSRYFESRASDLLLLDICGGDGWSKLCEFLNRPIPTQAFPHENRAS